MKNKILFITTLLPFPLNNGGKIKTYNTIKMLSERYDIDLICYYENDTDLEYLKYVKQEVREVQLVKGKITTSENKLYMLKLAFKSLFSKLPVTVLKFFDKEFSSLIEKYMNSYEYEKVYVDHLQISINLKNVENNNIEYILDEHNCEYLIMKRKFNEEKNVVKKLFFCLEYLKLKKYEKNTLDKFDKIITLSNNDKYELMKLNISESKMKIIPIPFLDEYIKKNIKEYKTNLDILFVGTMSWMPNSEGILWFLENVVPKLRENKLNFKVYIIGKGANKSILSYNNESDIEILGFVQDINRYIEKCDCMIVPIFFGSGLRVKIIEAFAKKIPVISTTIGAEGLKICDNKNILIANTVDEFNEKIKCMYNPKTRYELANNARITFEEEYSFSSIKNKFFDFIEEGSYYE